MPELGPYLLPPIYMSLGELLSFCLDFIDCKLELIRASSWAEYGAHACDPRYLGGKYLKLKFEDRPSKKLARPPSQSIS
jgi:hypothetical protein